MKRAFPRNGPANGKRPDLVVLGMGNPLLSDDGAGIEGLREIGRAAALPAGVRLVDAGTVGPGLLAAVAGCDGLVVLDAVDSGGQPGDVVRLDLRNGVGTFVPRTVHELGLQTLLEDLELMGQFPARAVLYGIQPGSTRLGTRLSLAVERALATLVRAALEELDGWAGTATTVIGDNPWTEDAR